MKNRVLVGALPKVAAPPKGTCFAARRRFIEAALTASVLAGVSPRVLAGEPRTGLRLAQGAPSATALGAAVQRALHQVIDVPPVLDDPLAIRIIGDVGVQQLQAAADRGGRSLRAYIALRSRHAEDRVADAVDRGVRQYVVLGAGLDSFAYRNPHQQRGLKVFEVDHPATQQWKRARLAAAGIAVPQTMTFVPVDFETQSLAEQLRLNGFRFGQPAFFSMLGVVVYLTEEALTETLRLVAGCAPGSGITFSFSLPDSHLSETALRSRERSRTRMAALGEPWRTFLEPGYVADKLHALGFSAVDMLLPAQANARYFAGRADRLRVSGSGHMATARV